MGSASALDGGSGVCLGPEEDQRTCSARGAGATCSRALSCGAFACGNTVARFDAFARERDAEPGKHDAGSWEHGGPWEYDAESREHGRSPEYSSESREHDDWPWEYDAESRERDGGPWEYFAQSREHDGRPGEHGRRPWEHRSRQSRSRQPTSGEDGISEGWRASEHPS